MKRAQEKSASEAPGTDSSAGAQGAYGARPGAGADHSSMRFRQLRYDDAKAYLQQVKNTFASKPNIYNKFLDIMKEFNSQSIDTPGVIERVSRLFQGHAQLILGFNTFLPPGYKIELRSVDGAPASAQAAAAAGIGPGSMMMPGGPSGIAEQGQASQVHSVSAGPGHPQQAQQAQQAQQMVFNPAMMSSGPAHMGSGAAAGSQQVMGAAAATGGIAGAPGGTMGGVQLMHGAGPAIAAGAGGAVGVAAPEAVSLDFDHAILYVTKIRQRFRARPEVYDSFLNILHAYQKEERDVKQVYEDVCALFEDHPDLIDEFRLFLPEPLMAPQARERRHVGGVAGAAVSSAGPGAAAATSAQGGRAGAAVAGSASLVGDSEVFDADMEEDERQSGLTFFEKVKSSVSKLSIYTEFLQTLHLFSREIISRDELVSIVEDLLRGYPDLVRDFHDFLAQRQTTDEDDPATAREREMRQRLSDYLNKPLNEQEFNKWERLGPSYRGLPDNYPIPHCSGRTPLCSSVLNDTWVSVPMGSEDFSFKMMRKNQYEESLFRCEDDRYELDTLIETNQSTIFALEPIAEYISTLKGEHRARFRLGDSLSVLHYKNIERMYGEQGQQVVAMLRRSPVSVIPVILPRLRQKDREWRKVKKEMEPTWRDVYRKNYAKSLDHRSFYFKNEDKRLLSQKAIVAALREEISRRRGLLDGDWHVDLHIPNGSVVHEDIFRVVAFVAEQSLSASEEAKVMKFWHIFLADLFGHPDMGHVYRARLAAAESASAAENEGEKESGEGDGEKSNGPGDSAAGTAQGDAAAASAAAVRADGAAAAQETAMDVDATAENSPEDASVSVNAKDDADAAAASGDARESESAGGAGANGGNDGRAPVGGSARNRRAPVDYAAMRNEYSRPAVERFHGCRPLQTAAKAAAAGARSQPATGRRFVGNMQSFIFFKLYSEFAVRLAEARRMSTTAAKKPQAPAKSELASELHADAGAAHVEEEAVRDPEECFEKFLEILCQAIAGQIDNTQYEDKCRTLLGQSSYVLFTLDKLVFKLIKQAQAMLQNDSCVRLHEMFMLSSVEPVVSPAQYEADARALVEDPDDMVMFAHDESDGVLHLRVLPHIVATDPNAANLRFKSGFADHMGRFIQMPRTECGKNPRARGYSQVILERNVPGDVEARRATMRGVVVTSALAFTVKHDTRELHYVPGTEDYFRRIRTAPQSSSGAANSRAAQRKARWEAWHAERLREMESAPADAASQSDENEMDTDELPSAPSAPARTVSSASDSGAPGSSTAHGGTGSDEPGTDSLPEVAAAATEEHQHDASAGEHAFDESPSAPSGLAESAAGSYATVGGGEDAVKAEGAASGDGAPGTGAGDRSAAGESRDVEEEEAMQPMETDE